MNEKIETENHETLAVAEREQRHTGKKKAKNKSRRLAHKKESKTYWDSLWQ